MGSCEHLLILIFTLKSTRLKQVIKNKYHVHGLRVRIVLADSSTLAWWTFRCSCDQHGPKPSTAANHWWVTAAGYDIGKNPLRTGIGHTVYTDFELIFTLNSSTLYIRVLNYKNGTFYQKYCIKSKHWDELSHQATASVHRG